MINRYKYITFFVYINLFWCTYGYSQKENIVLPTVFQIGEYEKQYDQLIDSHTDLLTSVCSNDMNQAYDLWTSFLIQLQNFTLENDFDIRGIKLWINVFWKVDGTISHIVFHPKPNSKNADYNKLTLILKQFALQSPLPIKFNKPFSHYGTASFPIHQTYLGKPEK